ncbi:hypothetical protein ZWY2020_017344 [Hordeum vulgare]|nr:hypothetical protein ZWY2020_017344 [Hordeum vulgare]
MARGGGKREPDSLVRTRRGRRSRDGRQGCDRVESACTNRKRPSLSVGRDPGAARGGREASPRTPRACGAWTGPALRLSGGPDRQLVIGPAHRRDQERDPASATSEGPRESAGGPRWEGESPWRKYGRTGRHS